MKLSTPSFLKKFKRAPKPTIGIDIGSHTIKLVELIKTTSPENEASYIIRRVGQALVPPNVVVDGSVSSPQELGDILRNLLENVKNKYRYASTSIAGYSVIVKRITVPFTDERDIEDNLIIEAENYVPFEIEDVYVDFHVIGIEEDSEKLQSDIFLVAAKKEIVDDYAAVIQEVGLSPAVVDVDAFAISNVFEVAYGDPDEAVVLVDIGASKTSLNIVHHGTSLFARDMAIGGDQLTEAISESVGISIQEAEILKLQGTDDPSVASEVSKLCEELAGMWAGEINKAIDFFVKGLQDEVYKPKHIVLSGGCSLMKHLDRFLEDEIHIPVQLFNPWRNMVPDDSIDPDYLRAIASQMVIATGLALRTVDT